MDTAAVGVQQGTYGTLFANSEFRALWLAQILSVLGDQLARVALTLLVYDRTRSPLLAAVTFAASVLPVFVGGLVLSPLADRLPRRAVMIACDLARMVLVLIMAIPGVPLPVLVGLLPLASHRNAEFLHNEVPGMRVPEPIRERMRKAGSGPKARGDRKSVV